MVTKSKKNTVSIYTQDGILRLNFRAYGKRYRFSLGYRDDVAYRLKAESIARTIELDILSGHFDPTLSRYKDKPIVEPVETSNAVPIKPKKRYNSRNPKRKPFSKDEVQRILDALYNDTYCSKFSRVKHSHYAPYYECLLLTACRPAEIIGLRWGDVHTTYIEISSALARDEKGRTASKHRVRKSTKTGIVRQIPLNAQLKKLFDRMRNTVCDNDPNELVFKSPNGLALDDRNLSTRLWKPLLEKLGIDHRVQYACRTSRATLLLEDGLPINQVSALLGHAEVATTVKHYIKGRMPSQLPEL